MSTLLTPAFSPLFDWPATGAGRKGFDRPKTGPKGRNQARPPRACGGGDHLGAGILHLQTQQGEAAEKAIAILSMKGIEVERARRLEEAAVPYRNFNVDFIDAFLSCSARDKGLKGLYMFDRKDFSKVRGLKLLP